MIHKYITHRNAYIFGLLGMVFCLSISEYALSVFQFFMAANWLLEGNRLKRAKAIFSNHDAWLLTSLLALGVVGLLYTSNFGYALDDLRIKLPLFLLPFLWAGYKPLSRKELQVIFAFFVLGLIISAGFTLKNYHYLPFADYNNIRSISQFVSHIRFSLMLVLAVFLMPFYFLLIN